MKARLSVLLALLAVMMFSGSCTKKTPTLNLLVWEGYADPSFVKAFEEQHHCKVSASYMGSSDELVAKLANNTKTDVPSNSAPPAPPANDNESDSIGEAGGTSDEPDTFTDQDESPPAQPKRGRGRPRKPKALH